MSVFCFKRLRLKQSRVKKWLVCAAYFILLCGCSPLVPSNYLKPSNMQNSQKIDGKRLQPRLIPINPEMFNTQEGRDLLAPAMKPQPYRVGAFDNLNVIVWGHPEISTVATAPIASLNAASLNESTGLNATNNPSILVETNGRIFFPYVGHLKVAGLTVTEIQQIISRRLSRYIRNPQVSIQVAKYRNRNVYVLGEVKKPGMQPLTDKPLSLMEAISNAGDLNTNNADPSHIYLVRGSYTQPDVFWLDARTPQSLLIAERFPLQEYDIVYVSAAILSPWNHFINEVLPSFSTYFTIKGLAN